MTLRKLFEMCTNCDARKIFKVMINGNVELLSISDGLEKYGEYKVYSFAIRGRIIEVILMRTQKGEYYDIT